MEYNTSRPLMAIPEYGRSIHKMVDFIKNLDTKEERNKASKTLIRIMGNLNPHLRNVEEYNQKLWDHLFIMADFELDIDAPYPAPSREEIQAKPARMAYPSSKPKYMHYGEVIEKMITEAVTLEDGEKKNYLVESIANYMKQAYASYNKGAINDIEVFEHLSNLSDNQINIDPEDMTLRKIAIQRRTQSSRSGGGGSNRGRRRPSRNRNNRKR